MGYNYVFQLLLDKYSALSRFLLLRHSILILFLLIKFRVIKEASIVSTL